MEKVSIVIIGVLLITIFIGAGCWFFNLSPTITEYKDTVARLEGANKLLRESLSGIEAANRDAERRIKLLIEDNRRTEKIVGEISQGLRGTGQDLSGIIELLSNLISSLASPEEIQ